MKTTSSNKDPEEGKRTSRRSASKKAPQKSATSKTRAISKSKTVAKRKTRKRSQSKMASSKPKTRKRASSSKKASKSAMRKVKRGKATKANLMPPESMKVHAVADVDKYTMKIYKAKKKVLEWLKQCRSSGCPGFKFGGRKFQRS